MHYPSITVPELSGCAIPVNIIDATPTLALHLELQRKAIRSSAPLVLAGTLVAPGRWVVTIPDAEAQTRAGWW